MTLKNQVIWIALAAALALSGCAHVNSVSLTSIPAKKGQVIRAERSKIIFLGFNFDNDFVDEMAESLRNQCRDGQVKGILTKDEAINYFLWIVHKRQVTAQGYCQKGAATASLGLGIDAADEVSREVAGGVLANE